MNFNKSKIIMNCILISMLLSINTISHAADIATIKFFSSNNTHEISVEKAYERLWNKAKHNLKDSTINVLQQNHMEQGRFKNILGMYQMNSDKHMTGDNTEIFCDSPLQDLSDTQVIALASQLANSLNQETIAVFIPGKQSSISDITVNFMSHKPRITETINFIHEKLPNYATAFSLHLSSKDSGFDNAEVTQIEWLDSRINIDEIKKVFPQENISSKQGAAYLVYKNGQTEAL